MLQKDVIIIQSKILITFAMDLNTIEKKLQDVTIIAAVNHGWNFFSSSYMREIILLLLIIIKNIDDFYFQLFCCSWLILYLLQNATASVNHLDLKLLKNNLILFSFIVVILNGLPLRNCPPLPTIKKKFEILFLN